MPAHHAKQLLICLSCIPLVLMQGKGSRNLKQMSVPAGGVLVDSMVSIVALIRHAMLSAHAQCCSSGMQWVACMRMRMPC
jgi:hypothetical protein